MNRIAIIGAGKVGTALAELFARHGHQVWLAGRSGAKLEENLAAGGADPTSINLVDSEQAVSLADLALITVADDAIVATCEALVDHLPQTAVLAHCSGVLNSQALAVAAERGLRVCSLHPLNTFPSLHSARELFADPGHGTYLYSEGDFEGLQLASRVFENCGFNIITIKPEQKVLYHAACVFACNYLTVLMDLSLRSAESAGLDRATFWQSVQPLITSTLRNHDPLTSGKSLSGPIARGDMRTVQAHLSALQAQPELRNSYVLLGLQALKLARENGQLSDAQISVIEEILEAD